MKGLALPALLIGFICPVYGQKIDHTASYRTISSDRYIRIHYENDYFSTTDFYYTQGINVEFVHRAISRFPLSSLLLRRTQKQMKFGVASEHLGYTPTSLTHPEILVGDRPFAATLLLKQFAVMNDSSRQYRVVSSVSAGIIGPWAGGKQLQTSIHRLINDKIPKGWEHQIHNDIVLNYQVDFEKALITSGKYFLMNGKVGGRVGTFSDKMHAGITVMSGLLDNPFKNFLTSKNNFRIYVYAEPLMNVVGYDASLQGGLFNRTSPYIISSRDIARLVFQYNAGLVIKVRSTYMEYFQSYLTKEFELGKPHQWGGIRLGWMIIPKK